MVYYPGKYFAPGVSKYHPAKKKTAVDGICFIELKAFGFCNQQ
jgi:hypothetical protein